MPVSEPIEVKAISLNLSPNVGADDGLISVRIVPDGRDGNVVFGRSLRPGEADDGRGVVVAPDRGERLAFKPGAIHFAVSDIDCRALRGPDGYARITNTIWTWLSFGNDAKPDVLRYLLAAARRLDGAHALLKQAMALHDEDAVNFTAKRDQMFLSLSLSEVFVVALSRTIDMLDGIRGEFSLATPLPSLLAEKKGGLTDMRNAFEHIEDRALGRVRGKAHADALSVFEQGGFPQKGLSYAGKTLDLDKEALLLLLASRQFILDAAIEIGGPGRAFNGSLMFFGDSKP
jgi:hypothetical protein